ncbi:MAG: SurA N-terminal domain-containing protein [Hyphomicrobium sp.]
MLESLRRGAQTLVAKLLFGLLVLSFGIWGVADVFTGGGRGAIATVGSTSITPEEFQRSYQNELDRFSREAKQRLTPEQGRALGLDRRVLAQLIGGAAIETHAEELGLALSDATLVDGVQKDPNFADADGKFSRAGFDALLRQMNLSEKGFLNLRRKDEIRTQLIGAFVRAQTAPKPLIDLMHDYNQEKRVIEFLTIDSAKAVTVVEPDDAKLKEIYEKDTSKFMTPEYRKFEVLSLSVDDLKSKMDVSEDEIKAAYETTKDNFDVPEQRRIQQIAFKDKTAAEAAAKALADGSKTFADVAKEAGAKDTDVDLGLVAKKQLIDPKIADAAFALEKDKFSGAVEGTFATVVLRVTQIEPAQLKKFEDVKDEVRDKLAADKARGELPAKFDEIDDSRLAGKTLKEIAAEKGAKLEEVAAADRTGLTPERKPALATPDLAKIAARVFAPEAGDEGETIELTGGGHAWVNVVSTEAPKQRAFEDVKEQVKGEYMVAETARQVADLVTKFVERLNAGEAITALEGAAGGKAETTDGVTRTTIPQGLTEGAVAQAFTLPKGRAGSTLTSDRTSQTVFRVKDIVPAAAATPAEVTVLRERLEEDLANQSLTEYTEALKTQLKASVNDAELKRTLGVSDQ